MSKKRVLIGLTLGVGFLVACGFVVGQPSVRVIQDAPPGPVSQLPATQPQLPVPGLAPADTNQLKNTRLTASGQQPTAVSTELHPVPRVADGGNETTPQVGNPTGRQEPAVSLEWVGPPSIKIGQPATFQIVVKNVSSAAVYSTGVRSRIPPGVTIKQSEPKGMSDGDLLTWDLGTVEPQQEKRIDLVMIPDAKGRCSCTATVTFSGSSSVQLQVQEPKLVLKAFAPEKVLLGDPVTTTLTVTNPGDGAADHVHVKAMLSDGLENARGRELEFDPGNLGPNESRSVEVVCATKSAGEQHCDATAVADGNLTSRDSAAFPVLQPKLEVGVAGPSLRYLERQGTYVFHVTNTGNAPASNVTLSEQLPAGFKFVNATGGGSQDYTTRTVSWFLGDLPSGQSREVNLQLLAVNIGEFKHVATARAGRGLEASGETDTRVEGLSALQFELIDLDDPVEVGANCRYEIRITNTGSKTETNIQVSCSVPEKMEFWAAQGAGNCKHRVEGKEIIFDDLPKLAPRADAIYRVNCRATAPGDIRFKARIKADSLEEPVNKEESTRVYADQNNKPPQK